jgi:single-stranded-DNA-specific exonuclease
MPSGPDGFVRDPHYTEEFERARALLFAHPGRWRVIYHYDGDGISAASSLLRALARLGYAAQATPLIGVEREKMEAFLAATPGPVIVVDTGASWTEAFSRHAHPVIILDHHRYPGVPVPPSLPAHVAFVNPLDWGVDGMTELCGGTLAWLYTVFLDPVNWDNAPWGLSGAIADRQHVGGFHGLNGLLVDEAVRRSLVERRPGLALYGASLEAALAHSTDPFFRGLSGRPDPARAFLQELGIDPTRPPLKLTAAETATLGAALRSRLEAAHVLPEFVRLVDQERYFLPSLGRDAEELSNLQNACGRAGIPGVGVAFGLGDPAAQARAERAEADWRDGILRGLRRVEDEGVNAMPFLRWFESPDTHLAGTQAGLSMNFLLPPDLPVFVFSERPPGPTKLSGRGTNRLVAQGLDLAAVCRSAAAEVGGEGGGHPVAAGATIPVGTRDRFLEAANRAVGAQLARSGR